MGERDEGIGPDDRGAPGVTRCSDPACRAPIRWAVTERGRRLCVDAVPNPAGTVVLLPGGRCRVPTKHERGTTRTVRWMSHWGTCLARDTFKRGGRQTPAERS